MRGFSSLNSRTLTYTDNRSPDVKTNYAVAFDISSNETTNTFLMKRSIEIEEIVKPEDANLIITIDTRAVSGVLVEWDALPAGVTTIDAGGLYIVNGVATVSDWNDIKEPTITVPVGYQGTFFYIVRLEWTTPTGQEYVEYTVGEYIPVSVLVSEFALAATPNRIVGVSAILPAQFGFAAEIVDIPLLVTTSIACQANRLKGIAAGLNSQAILTVIPEYIFTTTYLSLVNDAIYSASIENDISAVAPRVTLANEVDNLTVEIFSTQPGFINQLNSDGYLGYGTEPVTLSYSGTFEDFSNNGTKFITKELSGTLLFIKIYNYPDRSLSTSFTATVSSTIPTVSISENGSTIAIGDPQHDSSTSNVGRILVYTLSGSTYSLTASMFGDNVSSYQLGVGIAISSDGNTIIAGTGKDKVDVYNKTGTRLGSIAAPSGTSFFGNGDNRLQYANSGNRFIVSGNNTSTGRENNYLYTISNFSPLTIGEVSLTAANTFLAAQAWSGNSDFSLVGVETKIYNSSGTLLQTFSKNIDAISPDGTHIAIEDFPSTRVVHVGNSSTGWSYVYDVEGSQQYGYFKQDNSQLFNQNARTVLQNGFGVSFNNTTKTLTLTGFKSRINQSLDTLSLTPNAVSGKYQMNYKLISPTITYTRRQQFDSDVLVNTIATTFSIAINGTII